MSYVTSISSTMRLRERLNGCCIGRILTNKFKLQQISKQKRILQQLRRDMGSWRNNYGVKLKPTLKLSGNFKPKTKNKDEIIRKLATIYVAPSRNRSNKSTNTLMRRSSSRRSCTQQD